MIDVSTQAGAFGPSLLAVLAHEIAHKVLFDRKIMALSSDTLAYEFLTEVTAAYLGFGKLMLNGHRYATTRREDRSTSKREHRFGYLTTEEVALVHILASSLHLFRLSKEHDGLSPFASQALAKVAGDPRFGEPIRSAARIAPRLSYI